MLCNDCERRPECTKLCKQAEAYVSQDDGDYHKAGKLHFTPTEKSILTLLVSGNTKTQVCKCLKLSVHGLNVHISNLRKKSQGIVL